MTAAIIVFPSDRCRRALSKSDQIAIFTAASRAACREIFDAAVSNFAEGREADLSVAAMMRLALEGLCPTIRAEAKSCLARECNVKIMA